MSLVLWLRVPENSLPYKGHVLGLHETNASGLQMGKAPTRLSLGGHNGLLVTPCEAAKEARHRRWRQSATASLKKAVLVF